MLPPPVASFIPTWPPPRAALEGHIIMAAAYIMVAAEMRKWRICKRMNEEWLA